jgi:hypothetical protein
LSPLEDQELLLKTKSSVVPGGIGTMKLPASVKPLPVKKLTVGARVLMFSRLERIEIAGKGTAMSIYLTA